MTLTAEQFLQTRCLMDECQRAYQASNMTLITLGAKIDKDDPEAKAKHDAIQATVQMQRQHALALRAQVREFVPDWVGPFNDAGPMMEE